MGGSEEASEGSQLWALGVSVAAERLSGGRGEREGRNYSGPLAPCDHAPRGSDGKRPSCLPSKDVSCAGRSLAEPAWCPPQAFPRSLCSSATLGQSPTCPTCLLLYPLTAPSCQLQTGVKTPDHTSLRDSGLATTCPGHSTLQFRR